MKCRFRPLMGRLLGLSRTAAITITTSLLVVLQPLEVVVDRRLFGLILLGGPVLSHHFPCFPEKGSLQSIFPSDRHFEAIGRFVYLRLGLRPPLVKSEELIRQRLGQCPLNFQFQCPIAGIGFWPCSGLKFFVFFVLTRDLYLDLDFLG